MMASRVGRARSTTGRRPTQRGPPRWRPPVEGFLGGGTVHSSMKGGSGHPTAGCPATSLMLFILVATLSGANCDIDMCSNEVRYVSSGSISHADYPQPTTSAQCSCNFSTAEPSTAHVSLNFYLENANGHCEPVLILTPSYQICPTPGGLNSTVLVAIREEEGVTITFNNPNEVPATFNVAFSATRSVEVQCGPSALAGLPPIVAGGDGIHGAPPGTLGGNAGPDVTAIALAITVCLFLLLLILVAIFRWWCVSMQYRKKNKKAVSINNSMADTSYGVNPAFQATPKSSVFDVNSQVDSRSLSSTFGLNTKGLQPIEAPLTGLGALAAHSEPRLPDNPVSNGEQPHRQRPDTRSAQSDPLSAPNGHLATETPPQPWRPAPPLQNQRAPPMGPPVQPEVEVPHGAPATKKKRRRHKGPSERGGPPPDTDHAPRQRRRREPAPAEPYEMPLYPDMASPGLRAAPPPVTQTPAYQPSGPDMSSPPYPEEKPYPEAQVNGYPTRGQPRVEADRWPHQSEPPEPAEGQPQAWQPPSSQQAPSSSGPGRSTPEVGSPYHSPSKLPLDKAAFRMSADDLPFMDDEDVDTTYKRGYPPSTNGRVSYAFTNV